MTEIKYMVPTMPKKKPRAFLKKKPGAQVTSVGGGGSSITAAAVGAPFPNIYSFYSGNRIDIKLLEQTARAPPVARSLWQLQLIAFPRFDFKLNPPDDIEEDPDTVNEILSKLNELDHNIDTTILCVQALYDIMTYGSFIGEVTWKEDDDGYIVPDVVNRLPAASFKQAPPEAEGDRDKYMVGHILKGIIYNKKSKSYEYWQLQNNYGTTGIPINIPTEQVIHIKDKSSPFVDGEPYLQGIVSTISQLEFVRKRVMQTVSRIGSPKQIATVGVPPEYLDALKNASGVPLSVTSAIPGAGSNTADIMLTDLWDYARQLVENQSADLAVAVPRGIDLSWDQGHVAFNPTEIDNYLIKEAISHIFPRDMLEIQAAAISATSQPLLQLLKMMVQGWQNMCSKAFQEQIWNKFLEYNGYEGWSVTFEWDDLIPQDEQVKQNITLQRFINHVITLDEARESLGLPALDPAPWMEGLTVREVLEKELALWRNPMAGQQQQGGMPGMGMGSPEMGGMDLEALLGRGNMAEEPTEPETGLETVPETIPDDSNKFSEPIGMEFQSNSIKQNKTLDDIVTPNKLDAEAEDILGSLENDVMKILKKTKYFDKVLEE